MGWEGLFVIGLVVLVFIMLAVSSIAPDLILMGALVLLMLTGVLLPEQAFTGFANTGLMTIAALYIVAAGLRETGAIQYVTRRLLGEPDTVRSAQFRMLMPTAVLSAFLNNTTIVAMLIPAVQEWCQRLRMSPAKLLLPLSYIAILGGTCTLIGTSTNLVVNGLLQKSGHAGLGMFDITGIGLMLLVSGSIFLLLFGNRLLSNRSSVSEDFEKVREYHVDMIVTDVLDGKSLSVAGLANLGFGYLAELERNGEIIQSPEHDFVLQVGDQLSFIGSPRCAQELRSIQGLQPANTQFQQMTVVHFRRRLVEAVIGGDFPFLGKTIRECDFLGNYQAVVLSVSRGGQNPLQDKGLNSRLQVGDTLLLEAGKEFANQYRFRRDFMLVSALENSSPPNFQKARIALLIMGVMVALSTFNILPILQSAWLAAGVMLVTGCMNAGLARRSIDYTVLTVIGASFALGAAMESSGAAEFIAQQLMSMGHLSIMSALAAVYLLTTLFTNIITNNAAAILMFPICEVLAKQMGVDVVPFALTIMFAASASFMTPIGYQTNLMVYGPGGYRFTDYLRLGVPMNAIAGVVTLLGIQWLWL